MALSGTTVQQPLTTVPLIKLHIGDIRPGAIILILLTVLLYLKGKESGVPGPSVAFLRPCLAAEKGKGQRA